MVASRLLRTNIYYTRIKFYGGSRKEMKFK